MKYFLLVCDGMADEPVEELGGRTPLEAARTPNMDFFAQHGQVDRIAGPTVRRPKSKNLRKGQL